MPSKHSFCPLRLNGVRIKCFFSGFLQSTPYLPHCPHFPGQCLPPPVPHLSPEQGPTRAQTTPGGYRESRASESICLQGAKFFYSPRCSFRKILNLLKCRKDSKYTEHSICGSSNCLHCAVLVYTHTHNFKIYLKFKNKL